MPTPPDEVSLNKAAIIERALRRAFEEFQADPELKNWTQIDALTLNIERACQAAIDLALHEVAMRRLGIPQSSADAYGLLQRAGLIDTALTGDLAAMTGFRNVIVHEYLVMDLRVLRAIVEERWKTPALFCEALGLRIQP